MKWTEEKLQQLIKYRYENLSWVKISQIFGTSPAACARKFYYIRQSRNLDYSNRVEKYDAEQIKKDYDVYGHRYCIAQYGTYCIKFLQRRGFQVNKQVELNYYSDVFIKTNDLYYFAGFVASDGCLKDQNGGYRVTINLKYSDKYILQEFKNRIGGAIYDKADKSAAELIINDKILFDKLLEFNITPRKSLTLEPPNINLFPNNESLIDFIRGYFDGDGCVCLSKNKNKPNTYRPTVNFLGTYNFLLWIEEQIRTLTNTSKRNIVKHKRVYSLTYSSWEDFFEIMNMLYSTNNLKLERKYNKFQEIRMFREKWLIEKIESNDKRGLVRKYLNG